MIENTDVLDVEPTEHEKFRIAGMETGAPIRPVVLLRSRDMATTAGQLRREVGLSLVRYRSVLARRASAMPNECVP